MAAAAPGERPDREDLNVASFKRGEWGSLPVPLDPGFPAVAEALGDADALTEVPQEALMAVAYASGELPKLMAGTPDDLVATWEQEIDARGGLEDIAANRSTYFEYFDLWN